jgi:CRISPR-associated protein Cas1
MRGNFRIDLPLVVDLMEPLRPAVDRAILAVALSNVFTPEDFAINQVGGCRINPQMAKQIVNQCVVSTSAAPLIQRALTLVAR